ncbi:hypothetical protein ACWD0J_37370 [Streptomyces sp. NPDC003011]
MAVRQPPRSGSIRRAATPDNTVRGFFVAIARLTAAGHEYARQITTSDRRCRRCRRFGC